MPNRESRKNGTVAVVTNIPRPYRHALFGTVRERLEAERLALRVFYTSDPAKHLRRGSPSAEVADPTMESYVRGRSFRVGYDRVVAFPTRLRRDLRRVGPACVVAGGFGTDALISACWCHAARVPLVLWSGAWPGREGEIGRIQLLVRKRLVGAASAFIAYGTAAADYLTILGAGSERVFCAWNTVDLETTASAARAAAAKRSELAPKRRLAARNLLYVGTMVASKGLRELVLAALAVELSDRDWVLHLVGAGPLTDELKLTVRAAGKEAHFCFHGLLPAGDLAELLGVADGFLLPTKREAWGLVINEAMACGVPVVASPWAGATRDLIEDGVSGYVIEPTDTGALAAIMTRLLSGDPECKEVGRKGAETVRAKASLEKAAEGFVAAVRCALERPANG